MGVGYSIDLVICSALGVGMNIDSCQKKEKELIILTLFLKYIDMFDCVFPTRTARFGHALVDSGSLNLKTPEYQFDFSPLDDNCPCMVCKNYTRAYPLLFFFLLFLFIIVFILLFLLKSN